MQFGQESTRAFTMHTSVGDQQSEAVLVYNGKKHKVTAARPFNLGSEEDNDLVLDKPFISGFHCRISNDGGHWLITDLDSTNGTKVNGLKIKEAELPCPATIKLGKEVMTFDVPTARGAQRRAQELPRHDRARRQYAGGFPADRSRSGP